MRTSDAGFNLIRKYEGLCLKAHKSTDGGWTIGYKSSVGVRPWTVITEVQAEQRLREDIKATEYVIDQLRYLRPEMNQQHYDALVSFTYSVGVKIFIKSDLRKMIIADPFNFVIGKEFFRWIYKNGRLLPGLFARRQEEVDLYFSSHADSPYRSIR